MRKLMHIAVIQFRQQHHLWQTRPNDKNETSVQALDRAAGCDYKTAASDAFKPAFAEQRAHHALVTRSFLSWQRNGGCDGNHGSRRGGRVAECGGLLIHIGLS